MGLRLLGNWGGLRSNKQNGCKMTGVVRTIRERMDRNKGTS